jgi:S-DNA-T family DNA segregation ATPase FtsK/SpoIIIE
VTRQAKKRAPAKKGAAAKKRATGKGAQGGGGWLSAARRREVIGATIVAVSVITLVLFVSGSGPGRERWLDALRWTFGWGSWLFPFAFGALGAWLFIDASDGEADIAWGRPVAGLVTAVAVLGALHIAAALLTPAAELTGDVVRLRELVERNAGGGHVGHLFAVALTRNLGAIPSLAALLIVIVLAGGATAGRSVRQTLDAIGERVLAVGRSLGRGVRDVATDLRLRFGDWREDRGALAAAGADAPFVEGDALAEAWALDGEEAVAAEGVDPVTGEVVALGEEGDDGAGGAPAADLPRPEWQAPPIDQVFDPTAEVEVSPEMAENQARLIEQTLSEFGIPAKVVKIHRGPRITQFGLEPGYTEKGDTRSRVKVSRIVALQNDLALALAAAPLRIQAPVPGRPYLGIEVPNQGNATVALRTILESEGFQKLARKGALPIGIGRDIGGQAVSVDLARMPHLLIAGATGSGKSVAINVLICSLLMTHTPETLKLLLVDPKRVELVGYRGLPHLGAPVVVEVERVVGVLQWAVREMDRRYKAYAAAGVRNIAAWNAREAASGNAPMPYLVIIIDELADLMMVAPEEAERLITRLAQLARATGIHLVLATQRPSVDVVTGLIKANFPARMAFAVSSSIDSRVILDHIGAEKLLGQGDMLYMGSDSSKLRRMQGCFVSDEEIERLTRYWRHEARLDEPDAADTALTLGLPSPLIQPELWDKMMGGEDGDGALGEERDELWEEAVAIIQQHRTASTSFLQRKLRVGYSRAARLLDALEQAGLVGPPQGNLGREVLIDAEDDPDEVAADYRASLERAFEDEEEGEGKGPVPDGGQGAAPESSSDRDRTQNGPRLSGRLGKGGARRASKGMPAEGSAEQDPRGDVRGGPLRDDGWDDWA